MPASVPALEKGHSEIELIDISVKGKWTKVPALSVDEKRIFVKGRWIRNAIVEAEEWLETEVQDPEQCIRKLRGEKSSPVCADIFTFTQKLPATTPKYQYPMEWHSVAAVHVTAFKDWWEKLPQETRKNVRRSQKRGVVVSVRTLDDDLISGIVEVNNDSPIRQKIPFSHYGKNFEQVRTDQSSFLDRSDFICAYFGSELVGFLKLVHRGDVASILQILPKASHYDKRPGNALIAKAVEICEAKGVSYLTYGMFNYGNKRDSSLLNFKVRNGFEEVLVPRYYVPLTHRGVIWVKLKLHRGLLGILPPSVIRLGVAARGRWYDLKNKKAGVAQC